MRKLRRCASVSGLSECYKTYRIGIVHLINADHVIVLEENKKPSFYQKLDFKVDLRLLLTITDRFFRITCCTAGAEDLKSLSIRYLPVPVMLNRACSPAW